LYIKKTKSTNADNNYVLCSLNDHILAYMVEKTRAVLCSPVHSKYNTRIEEAKEGVLLVKPYKIQDKSLLVYFCVTEKL